jgi:molybdenum ABC transporter molybdate-binding protein
MQLRNAAMHICLSLTALALPGLLGIVQARAATVEVFHADSLAGPMQQLKKAFEAANAGVAINLTSGVSKQLAERILKGDGCDVFAPSSPAVIDDDLMGKKIAGTAKDAASWYVVFSSNEMVVITEKGNPLGIRQVSDLAKPNIKFVRATGAQDLATNRTADFLKRAAAAEGKPELAAKINDSAVIDPAKPTTVPDTIRLVKEGKANAGVTYYSAAVVAKNDLEIIRFPAGVNLSDSIRNAATVPGSAKNPKEAMDFVVLLMSVEGQRILTETGQPPIVPALRKGDVPAEIK